MLRRVRSETETESRAAVCLSDTVRSVRETGRRPGGRSARQNSEPAGPGRSVQVISASVVCRRQNRVLPRRLGSTSLGLKSQQWFLSSF